ncbi:hypothetical protein EDD16DRAFT_1520666 [Pisolithus croceorrhizus]|nr:hypothetical protein EDD16DRAFT_1520666 [Pisolithus croceorrhizus]
MSTGQTGVGSSLKISGHRGHESECGSGVDSNMGMNAGHQGHKSESGSGREVDRKRLSDNLALPLRVAHTMVVPRGYGGALTSRAETHLVKSFGSVAFGYPHPPMKKQNEYAWQGENVTRGCKNSKGECGSETEVGNCGNMTETEDTRPKTAKTEAPCSGLQMKSLNKKLLWIVVVI